MKYWKLLMIAVIIALSQTTISIDDRLNGCPHFTISPKIMPYCEENTLQYKTFIFYITIVKMKENIAEPALIVLQWCMAYHKVTLNCIHYCIPAVLVWALTSLASSNCTQKTEIYFYWWDKKKFCFWEISEKLFFFWQSNGSLFYIIINAFNLIYCFVYIKNIIK